MSWISTKVIVIIDINANTDTVEFTNGRQLRAGEATQDPGETNLRRIQIREAIKAHLEKERDLYDQGIKVLTLFFIDEVAKYRLYTDTSEERGGEYAKMFEEEYQDATNQKILGTNKEYEQYRDTPADQIHNGYFSIDKKSRRMVDPAMNATEMRRGEANDVDAYDLILKDKERLLSFEEPTRFIFSHSALREGWDNPNVFVICTLKHSDNTISRRQEVGRVASAYRSTNEVSARTTQILSTIRMSLPSSPVKVTRSSLLPCRKTLAKHSPNGRASRTRNTSPVR